MQATNAYSAADEHIKKFAGNNCQSFVSYQSEKSIGH